jgi:putative hydrolase of the HAD superfamily
MLIPSFIILDLDDTILDYSAPGEKIWKRLYGEYSRRLEIPVAQLQRVVDDSRRWYWSDVDRFREGRLDLKRARRIFLRDAFGKLGRTDWETADEFADTFTRDRETAVQPFDGAIDALQAFRSGGSRMALLTNGESSVQRAKIERFRLAPFFDAVFIESETGIGKPDPRAHRAALASLGVEPPQAWMIGDDLEFDIRPAKALGMLTAWIHDPAGGPTDAADCSVPSLRALARQWRSLEPDSANGAWAFPDKDDGKA